LVDVLFQVAGQRGDDFDDVGSEKIGQVFMNSYSLPEIDGFRQSESGCQRGLDASPARNTSVAGLNAYQANQ
jgi:hypothetical protein